MKYNATITYDKKAVTIKVTNKELEGISTLPHFLKKVRLSKKHTIEQTHLYTDYTVQDCADFENGIKAIPKEYLNCFSMSYKLPAKLKRLGYEEIKKENPLPIIIRNFREKENYTQDYVAIYLGVARATYAAYESGKNEPDIKALIKLAELYNTSIDILVGRY